VIASRLDIRSLVARIEAAWLSHAVPASTALFLAILKKLGKAKERCLQV
jgi:hypothetical protein